MTPAEHSIGKDQGIPVARELMNKYRLGHLPVLEHGKLVGMLTERDLVSLEAMLALDPDDETVEDGMTEDVYRATPDGLAKDVIGEMAKQKCGSAVVMDETKVLGIFTTTDAITLLSRLL